ncbi:MAG TPA: metal-dependent hydrolase, partial [Elainellaceae cyanobacterium]
MMSVTHCAIAICSTSIAIGTANPFVLLSAAIGSQIPDVDTTESFIGRLFFPVAKWLEERFPHRTITHSFMASGVVAIACVPLFLIHWHYWAAIVLGHFCGWFSDCFTKAGVAAFYPSPARLVIPGNPRARLESKSPSEYWILAIALFLTVVSVNLISAGGISEQFALSFFSDSATAAEMFRKHGSERMVLVDVQGIHNYTSQAVSGSYVVIESTASDVIAEDPTNSKLYKIGSAPDVQIRPTRIKTSLGDRLSIQAQEVALQEIAVSDWIARLPQNAYVTGSLLLDDIEDVLLPVEIESYPT